MKELIEGDIRTANLYKSVCVAGFDLGTRFPIPRVESTFDFRRKITMSTLPIYDLTSKTSLCYVWNETIGVHGANEFSSCLWRFIESKVKEGITDFRFYTSIPRPVNRNKMLFSMYTRAAQRYNVVITHR